MLHARQDVEIPSVYKRHLFHLQLPNRSGQAWPSMGKSTKFMGQSALIVSLVAGEPMEKTTCQHSDPGRCKDDIKCEVTS